jgi:hypothetical protein
MMPLLSNAILAASAATFLAAGPATGDPLAAHRWQSRVLVVIAPDLANRALIDQLSLFEASRAANRERDLVLVQGIGTGAEAADLRRRFAVPGNEFRAILVGKDGGAKLSESRPLRPEELFKTIDAMPMRRDEMRGRRS